LLFANGITDMSEEFAACEIVKVVTVVWSCRYLGQLADSMRIRVVPSCIVLTTKQVEALSIALSFFDNTEAGFVQPQWFRALISTNKQHSLSTSLLSRSLYTTSFTNRDGVVSLSLLFGQTARRKNDHYIMHDFNATREFLLASDSSSLSSIHILQHFLQHSFQHSFEDPQLLKQETLR
jgi:hypothetical protein